MKLVTKFPLQVWMLTLAVFVIGIAEFIVVGILPEIAVSLQITEGQAGNLITAYALAIVIGGPILTFWLVRFEKRNVLLGLMTLFIVGNLISTLTTNYEILLLSRVIAGLTQGPFHGIGAVMASRLVPPEMSGRAVGQMFAGLTLANVLGVPVGTWIGKMTHWSVTFGVVTALAVVVLILIALSICPQGKNQSTTTAKEQLIAFKNKDLLASLTITILAWSGFMTFYGYIAPLAERVMGFESFTVTWILVIVGIGLVIGNNLGAKTADFNLKRSLILWPLAMIICLIITGIIAPNKYLFLIMSFIFGVTSFANVPPMQMRVMKYSSRNPEMASSANISAFNIANAIGAFIGGKIVDSSLGASAIPYAASLLSLIGFIFILTQELKAKKLK